MLRFWWVEVLLWEWLRMSQLGTLVWLKWRLFRNALRSRKAVASRAATAFGMLLGLAFALLMALTLGFVAYTYASPPRAGVDPQRALQEGTTFLFVVFLFLFMFWAVVPLGLGGGNQFDPGRLSLYPVSLVKLFLFDLVSDLANFSSILAAPVVLAMAFGVGLATRNVVLSLVLASLALAFGMAFAKFMATSMGALLRKRRTRGETLLALLGALLGLFGAFLGQVAPYFMPYISGREGLLDKWWWTPPGAVALGLMKGLRTGSTVDFVLAVATLAFYALIFVVATYWIARRAALGMNSVRRVKRSAVRATGEAESLALGWQLPFVSNELSAVVEKELRYAMRNAQLRLMLVMPLILVGIRLMRRGSADGRGGGVLPPEAGWLVEIYEQYGEGLAEAGGLLYVFLLTSSFACNLFAFEEDGMRAYVLAPIERRTILVGKNIVVAALALLYATVFFGVSQIVFRDMSLPGVGFASLCFVLFAVVMSLAGNWLSIHFPKRMPFGKRMNLSGVAGLLFLPMLAGMALLPVLAVAAGYFAGSVFVKYATLASLMSLALVLYVWLVNMQARALERQQLDILAAVSGRSDN
ncbi:MAG TPA: hypothetical protein VF666_14050 [Pyrinomonadaceae bacterium]